MTQVHILTEFGHGKLIDVICRNQFWIQFCCCLVNSECLAIITFLPHPMTEKWIEASQNKFKTTIVQRSIRTTKLYRTFYAGSTNLSKCSHVWFIYELRARVKNENKCVEDIPPLASGPANCLQVFSLCTGMLIRQVQCVTHFSRFVRQICKFKTLSDRNRYECFRMNAVLPSAIINAAINAQSYEKFFVTRFHHFIPFFSFILFILITKQYLSTQKSNLNFYYLAEVKKKKIIKFDNSESHMLHA